MHWSSLSEFIRMGGYGPYVWGSYGVTLVLLGGEVLMLLKRRRAVARIAPEPKPETRKPKFETAMVSDKL
jgi:heme exporter protein D